MMVTRLCRGRVVTVVVTVAEADAETVTAAVTVGRDLGRRRVASRG